MKKPSMRNAMLALFIAKIKSDLNEPVASRE